jgi:hypothetical protein
MAQQDYPAPFYGPFGRPLAPNTNPIRGGKAGIMPAMPIARYNPPPPPPYVVWVDPKAKS